MQYLMEACRKIPHSLPSQARYAIYGKQEAPSHTWTVNLCQAPTERHTHRGTKPVTCSKMVVILSSRQNQRSIVSEGIFASPLLTRHDEYFRFVAAPLVGGSKQRQTFGMLSFTLGSKCYATWKVTRSLAIILNSTTSCHSRIY